MLSVGPGSNKYPINVCIRMTTMVTMLIMNVTITVTSARTYRNNTSTEDG